MINIYVKKLDKDIELLENVGLITKYNIKIFNNIIIKIKKKLNIITVKKIDENKYIYVIPDIEDNKIYVKLNKRIKKENNKIKNTINNRIQLIIDKRIKKHIEKLTEFKIVYGKEIFKFLIEDILKYLIEKFNIENKLEMQDVYIVTNTYDNNSISIINYLLEKVKTLNIVTNEIAKYSILEENIYNEKGIILSISNNKKKSLKKAKIIININLEKDEFIKYSINRNSVIINLLNEKIDYLKSFDGIIINNAEVDLNKNTYDFFKENNLINNFDNIELYESININNYKYSDNIYKIRQDNIIIKSLIGNNGIIDKKQIINNEKMLTKHKI